MTSRQRSASADGRITSAEKGLVDLPQKIVADLLAYVDVRSLFRLEQTCRGINQIITENAGRLRKAKNYLFWFIISQRERRYLCVHGLDGTDMMTELDGVWTNKNHPLQFLVPKHEVTFDGVPFLVSYYEVAYSKPIYVFEPLKNVPKETLMKAYHTVFQVFFRHFSPFHLTTNISTSVLKSLLNCLPKSIDAIFYDHDAVATATETELLEILENFPKLDDFGLQPSFRLTLNFYAHAVILNLERFRYTGPTDGMTYAESIDAMRAFKHGHKYVPPKERRNFDDDALVAVKWQRGEVHFAHVTSDGIRRLLLDWLANNRDLEDFNLYIQGDNVTSGECLEGIQVESKNQNGRVFLRRASGERLRVHFVSAISHSPIAALFANMMDHVFVQEIHFRRY